MKHNLVNYTIEQKRNTILQVSFEVGGNLLNKMWKPKEQLMNKINYYVDNVFKGYFVIGIQLRTLYFFIHLSLRNSFINCSLEIEANISKTYPNFNSKYKGFKWFVTSDKSNEIDRLKQEFPNKIIVGEGQVGHVEANVDSYQRTILDFELLSRCNELILTGGSTFGIYNLEFSNLNNFLHNFILLLKILKKVLYPQ